MHRILIVDDDERIRRMLIRSFDNEYKLVEAASGEEALTILSEAQVRLDLVLLDQMMPCMNGLETLAAIRQLDPYLPVVMLTAHGSLPLGIEFMRNGGSDFIQKPILDMEVVRFRIQRAIATSDELRRAVAQREEAERALLANEERYRLLIDQAPDGILIADSDGKLMDLNRCVSTLIGESRERLLEQSLMDLIVGGAASDILQQLETALPTLVEFELQHRGGVLIPVEICSKVLADGRLQCIVRDITERKCKAVASEVDLCHVNTLCIVDRHSASLDFFKRQLPSWGLQVTCVVDSLSVQRMLLEAHGLGASYNLVICDRQALRLNDTKLLHFLISSPRLVDIPLIFIGHDNLHLSGQKILDRCIVTQLPKPYRPNHLLAHIANAVGKSNETAQHVDLDSPIG